MLKLIVFLDQQFGDWGFLDSWDDNTWGGTECGGGGGCNFFLLFSASSAPCPLRRLSSCSGCCRVDRKTSGSQFKFQVCRAGRFWQRGCDDLCFTMHFGPKQHHLRGLPTHLAQNKPAQRARTYNLFLYEACRKGRTPRQLRPPIFWGNPATSGHARPNGRWSDGPARCPGTIALAAGEGGTTARERPRAPVGMHQHRSLGGDGRSDGSENGYL
jgi:hypothetical protein